MESQIESILNYLQSIQGDLVGIIIPAILTAAVSLFSLFVTSIISIVQDKEKHNHEQFKCMQEIFASLKICLQNMCLSASLAKGYSLSYGGSISQALINYCDYSFDETTYRAKHQAELNEIDNFISFIKKYIEEVKNLREVLKTKSIPAAPLLHPLLKRDIYRMLETLQYWSCLLSEIQNSPLNDYFLHNELSKCKLDDFQLKNYIEILDKWYRAY